MVQYTTVIFKKVKSMVMVFKHMLVEPHTKATGSMTNKVVKVTLLLPMEKCMMANGLRVNLMVKELSNMLIKIYMTATGSMVKDKAKVCSHMLTEKYTQETRLKINKSIKMY